MIFVKNAELTIRIMTMITRTLMKMVMTCALCVFESWRDCWPFPCIDFPCFQVPMEMDGDGDGDGFDIMVRSMTIIITMMTMMAVFTWLYWIRVIRPMLLEKMSKWTCRGGPMAKFSFRILAVPTLTAMLMTSMTTVGDNNDHDGCVSLITMG